MVRPKNMSDPEDSEDEVQVREGKRQKVKHHVQVYDVDFTFFGKDDFFPDVEAFVKLIQPLFKKWVFQLEKCPTTGRLHYQGRGSLIKKKRMPELWRLLNDTDLCGMDTSECSAKSRTREQFYSLKYETKVDGPWKNTTWKAPAYIPRQYRGLLEKLYPWQQQILDSKGFFDDRHVNLLYDPSGCKGKSTIARLCALHHRALKLPAVGDAKQLIESACDILMAQENREPGLCFIDLPRTMTMDVKKFVPSMIAIEEIKSGFVYDMRNHYKEWWFDSPATWVTCNHLPDLKYLSKDRWQIWMIADDNHLEQVDPSEFEESPI